MRRFKEQDGKVFEVEEFNFDIEQTLNIGSQSRGTGAGKVTFNRFTITRKIDQSSPVFFQMACSGTPFALVSLGFRKAGGGDVLRQLLPALRLHAGRGRDDHLEP